MLRFSFAELTEAMLARQADIHSKHIVTDFVVTFEVTPPPSPVCCVIYSSRLRLRPTTTPISGTVSLTVCYEVDDYTCGARSYLIRSNDVSPDGLMRLKQSMRCDACGSLFSFHIFCMDMLCVPPSSLLLFFSG